MKRRRSRLKFPKLLFLVVMLFLLDLIIPDFVPVVDELILGLMAAILATLREKPAAGNEHAVLPTRWP